MKIVFLTDQVYLHGGVEKVLATKVNFLVENYNYDVSIITTEQKNKKPCYNFSNLVKFYDLGVNYTREKSYFHPENLLKAWSHFFKIKKKIKELKPDVIIVCNYAFDFYFLPYIANNIPKIKEFHSSRYLLSKENVARNYKEKLMGFLSKNAEAKYHQLVVLNPAEIEFYNSDRISVIPNPIPLSEIKINPENKKIIAAGRISPVKNFGDAIDVFNDLKQNLQDWELHFYGENYLDTQEKLNQKIIDYGLQNQVKFLGTTDNMLETMKEYSIYAMTSETECFPMVLLESLSVGLPIISYNCPTGPQFIVKNNQDGFLAADKEDFKNKLKSLTEDVELRRAFSNNGKQNAKRFSNEEVMQLWQNLLLHLQNV